MVTISFSSFCEIISLSFLLSLVFSILSLYFFFLSPLLRYIFAHGLQPAAALYRTRSSFLIGRACCTDRKKKIRKADGAAVLLRHGLRASGCYLRCCTDERAADDSRWAGLVAGTKSQSFDVLPQIPSRGYGGLEWRR